MDFFTWFIIPLEMSRENLYNVASMINYRLVINGPTALEGEVSVSGAKNASLPELAASILTGEKCVLERVPEIEDIKTMLTAIRDIGGSADLDSNRVEIKMDRLVSPIVKREISETSRSSILILGPLIARNGYAKVAMPGGCDIGDRNINYHIEGLRRMGVNIDTEQEKGYIIAESKRLKGIDFVFPGKTVTGTENILMASVLAEGETILKNCAVEPEVTDLAEYLVSMGAEIDGIGTDMLVIKGKSSLHGASHSVIPDRIEAGTYLIAACFKGNNIKIKGGNPGHIKSVLDILGNIGCRITSDNGIMSVSKGELKNGIHVETEPFPGFPTDLQAQLTTLMTQIEGISSIRENIFNNRFKHAIELNKLGADIEISENKSIIKGRTHLTGAYVRATDLRASASLVLAGLLAEGKTVIDNSYQLFRGYEDMHIKLNKIGADIKVIEV